MANYRKDSSEEEALFRSYPYALYFVQSPSTHSHANSTTNITNYDHFTTYQSPDNGGPAHLRHSSSRGSNDSFAKKIKYSQDLDQLLGNVVDQDEEEEEEDELDLYDEKKRGWTQYFSFGYSDSGWWVFVQLSWRFLLSLILAFAVFYVAAKPPAPKVSIKVIYIYIYIYI
ncbi:hypothetical protein PHJA_001355000 [Phtheirospermum japonicum]|uniref:Uncharacterized protein n=1 Tax=Phtheirospermum japonicum TaxID=374723 RepID=A0A830BZL0_9LAMI|nr:hypothetical protein PHJA_001355000 [Phtheirospermum japonicum]